MSTSWVDFTVSNVIVHIDIAWYIFETRLEIKNICKLNKGNPLNDLFSQFVSSKIFFAI